jgi:hypothetical protein
MSVAFWTFEIASVCHFAYGMSMNSFGPCAFGQLLESACDSGRKHLSQVGRLRGISLLHLLQEQQPGVVLRLDLSLVTLGQIEGLDRIAESLDDSQIRGRGIDGHDAPPIGCYHTGRMVVIPKV